MIFRILRRILRERSRHTGRIFARALPPDLTKEEFEKWWPRLTEKERDRYTVYTTTNVITLNGRNAILNYIGNNSLSGTGTTGTACVPFSQYFSVGTGAIATVSAGDNAMVGELYRAVPSSATATGNSVNISTFFSAGVANGNYTNAALFGNNATGTLSTGTLMTHALYTYPKTNASSLVSDYLINEN
jgi:hypothetical protein